MLLSSYCPHRSLYRRSWLVKLVARVPCIRSWRCQVQIAVPTPNLLAQDILGFSKFLRVDCVWNVMAHTQKPDFVFRRNGLVHLNSRGRQFRRLLAAEVCSSAVVMLDTPCSEVVWRVLATQTVRQFPLHFPSRASPCPITFQLDSKYGKVPRIYAITYSTSFLVHCSLTIVPFDAVQMLWA